VVVIEKIENNKSEFLIKLEAESDIIIFHNFLIKLKQICFYLNDKFRLFNES